jgi:MFS family permease
MANSSSRSVSARGLAFLAIALTMLGNHYVYDSLGPVAGLLSTQLGFSDLQIGSLNGIYSLPNIVLVLLGGILIDRHGGRRVMLWTATLCLLGAIITAVGSKFPVMALGRLLFGVGAETLAVAVLAALSAWFRGSHLALCVGATMSISRLGSYLADRSPTFAHSLYDHGWQMPLWLAAGFAALSLFGVIAYGVVEGPESKNKPQVARHTRTPIEWRSLFRFPAQYWCLIGLCVAFYSAIFPFRSTFAIKYFQQARGLALEDASRMNSVVFLTAIFATPVFGWLVDRIGRPSLLLVVGSLLLPLSFLFFASSDINLVLPTALLGVSYSLIPAVLWPSVSRCVPTVHLGTAYGLMVMLQNTGLTLSNVVAGHLNDVAHASALHPKGYASMLWFFGILGLVGFFFAVFLKWVGGGIESSTRFSETAITQ